MAPKKPPKDLYDDPNKYLSYRVALLEKKINTVLGLSGLSAGLIITAAFWMGTMYNTTTTTGKKMDRLNDIVLESSDSLASRTKVIESKIDSLDKKVTEALSVRTQPLPSQR